MMEPKEKQFATLTIADAKRSVRVLQERQHPDHTDQWNEYTHLYWDGLVEFLSGMMGEDKFWEWCEEAAN